MDGDASKFAVVGLILVGLGLMADLARNKTRRRTEGVGFSEPVGTPSDALPQETVGGTQEPPWQTGPS